ncbi:hypothetical protein Bca101_020210 [Brassica carinata]
MACIWESQSWSRREIFLAVELHGPKARAETLVLLPELNSAWVLVGLQFAFLEDSRNEEVEYDPEARAEDPHCLRAGPLIAFTILDASRGFDVVASCLVLGLYLDLWQGNIQHVCLVVSAPGGCIKSHPGVWRLDGFFVQGRGGRMNFSSRDLEFLFCCLEPEGGVGSIRHRTLSSGDGPRSMSIGCRPRTVVGHMILKITGIMGFTLLEPGRMDQSGAGPSVWIAEVYLAENASSHGLASSTAD